MATNASASARSLDDLRVRTAVETIRALRAAGADDPFAALRADLHDRLTGGREDQREVAELLLLAETLTTLAAEAGAMALLHDQPRAHQRQASLAAGEVPSRAR